MESEYVEEIITEPDEPQTSILTTVYNGLIILQANAWYIVIVAVICYYFWNKKLSSLYQKWLENREKAQEEAKIKKNPDYYFEREKARLAAVRKLQEKYDKEAVEKLEILKQKEEKKREEWLEKQACNTTGRKLNEEYNPLMGKSGPSYRASRRSACSGGSCGKK